VVSGFDDKTKKGKRWIWLEERVDQARGNEKVNFKKSGPGRTEGELISSWCTKEEACCEVY